MKNSVPASSPQTAPSAADEGRLVAELRSLKGQRSPRSPRIARAVQVLEATSSPRVRNAAASALADLRARSAKDRLIDLLARPETRGSRGTLLYALEQLGANVPLPILAEIIADESYEAREEALGFIACNRIECSAEEFARSKEKLEGAIAAADPDRIEAVQRALEYLRTKHNAVKNVAT